mgnify:CR=1 FL=1
MKKIGIFYGSSTGTTESVAHTIAQKLGVASNDVHDASKLTGEMVKEYVEKRKNDVDELVNAFSIMTAELKQNLNEATRQKRQIETILLHMTDGIIAFNRKGEIKIG